MSNSVGKIPSNNLPCADRLLWKILVILHLSSYQVSDLRVHMDIAKWVQCPSQYNNVQRLCGLSCP